MKLSDVYSEYITNNKLYDKYGIATITLKRYRNKEGKRIVSLEDAWKLKPTVYVKGSWQKEGVGDIDPVDWYDGRAAMRVGIRWDI